MQQGSWGSGVTGRGRLGALHRAQEATWHCGLQGAAQPRREAGHSGHQAAAPQGYVILRGRSTYWRKTSSRATQSKPKARTQILQAPRFEVASQRVRA